MCALISCPGSDRYLPSQEKEYDQSLVKRCRGLTQSVGFDVGDADISVDTKDLEEGLTDLAKATGPTKDLTKQPSATGAMDVAGSSDGSGSRQSPLPRSNLAYFRELRKS